MIVNQLQNNQPSNIVHIFCDSRNCAYIHRTQIWLCDVWLCCYYPIAVDDVVMEFNCAAFACARATCLNDCNVDVKRLRRLGKAEVKSSRRDFRCTQICAQTFNSTAPRVSVVRIDVHSAVAALCGIQCITKHADKCCMLCTSRNKCARLLAQERARALARFNVQLLPAGSGGWGPSVIVFMWRHIQLVLTLSLFSPHFERVYNIHRCVCVCVFMCDHKQNHRDNTNMWLLVIIASCQSHTTW